MQGCRWSAEIILFSLSLQRLFLLQLDPQLQSHSESRDCSSHQQAQFLSLVMFDTVFPFSHFSALVRLATALLLFWLSCLSTSTSILCMTQSSSVLIHSSMFCPEAALVSTYGILKQETRPIRQASSSDDEVDEVGSMSYDKLAFSQQVITPLLSPVWTRSGFIVHNLTELKASLFFQKL